jgi:hypothetical protein
LWTEDRSSAVAPFAEEVDRAGNRHDAAGAADGAMRSACADELRALALRGEIAGGVLLLASDESSSTTATNFLLDGGLSGACVTRRAPL